MGRRGCLQLLNAQSVHSCSWPLESVTGAASSCHLCNSVITPRVSVSKSANNRRVLQCPRNEEKHNGLALCLWGMPPCGLAQGSLICDMGWGTLVAPVLRRCPRGQWHSCFFCLVECLGRHPIWRILGNEFERKERSICMSHAEKHVQS